MEDFVLWQQFGIPLSLAYFMADILWYCIPSGDGLILFHHITMLLCHYPVSSDVGAKMCGAGNALWTVRLSMMGYLCELSNPLMNWRWWLLQVSASTEPTEPPRNLNGTSTIAAIVAKSCERTIIQPSSLLPAPAPAPAPAPSSPAAPGSRFGRMA